jgi:hypothetical protein
MSAVETTVSDTVDKRPQTAPEPPKRIRVGTGMPGPGRPKGSQDRITRTIKDAIEIAAKECHPQGLAGWLLERAQGGVEDRKIFAGMVAKVIPAQLQASVQGGIVVQLPWLQGRNVGGHVPSTSHSQAIDAQVIDITVEKGGNLRVADPRPALEAPATGLNANHSHPHPPIERQAGGGEE